MDKQIVCVLSEHLMDNSFVDHHFQEIVSWSRHNSFFHYLVVDIFHSFHSIGVVNLRVLDEEFFIKESLWVGKFEAGKLFNSRINARVRAAKVWNASTHTDPSPCHNTYVLETTLFQAREQISVAEIGKLSHNL